LFNPSKIYSYENKQGKLKVIGLQFLVERICNIQMGEELMLVMLGKNATNNGILNL
jgi:hypothetical protein